MRRSHINATMRRAAITIKTKAIQPTLDGGHARISVADAKAYSLMDARAYVSTLYMREGHGHRFHDHRSCCHESFVQVSLNTLINWRTTRLLRANDTTTLVISRKVINKAS